MKKLKEGFDFDGALKELFQQDRPSLLQQLSGGVKVREFLNVELPRVQARRVDLVLLLEDDTLVHVEIQSTNDRKIPYRMISYYGLLKDTYGRALRQVVLYVGSGRLSMPGGLSEDGNRFVYGVVDIRYFDAAILMRSGSPADLALAILAGGGDARLPEILRKAARLKGPKRAHVLAQILILAGLRGLAGLVEWRLREIGMVIDVTKNPVLMKWRREAVVEGRAEGLAEGLAEGRAEMFHEMMVVKFGALPRWVEQRLAKASSPQVLRWARRIPAAESVEEVVGKR